MNANHRSEEITAALLPAYKNASKLKLSKAEIKRLMKPFPDTQIEVRTSDGAIFIPHIFLSQRLNEVFSPGGWSLVCREHRHDEDSQMLRAEHILIVRQCFIGEAVGEFHFNGLEGEKYGDALEATAAEALRRICGKRLSCGSQLWQPDFCKSWIAKHAESFAGEGGETLWRKKGSKDSGFDTISESPRPKAGKVKADDNLRHIMLQLLCLQGRDNVEKYAVAKGILKAGQPLEEWPLDQVAVGEKEVRRMQLDIQNHFKPATPKDWREFPMPFGVDEGKPLGKLRRAVLKSYWQDVKGEAMTKAHPGFREALDAAGEHYKFKP